MVFKATPDLSQNFYALVRVFTPSIWAITLGTMIAFVIFLTATYRVFAEDEDRAKPINAHMASPPSFTLAFPWDDSWLHCRGRPSG